MPNYLASANIYQTETVSVTSAEILDLFSTPKRLLRQLPASQLYDVASVIAFLDFSGAAYVAANGLNVRITGATNPIFGAAPAFLQASADQWCRFSPPASPSNNMGIGAAVELYESTANPITGGGSLTIYITYRIIVTG